MSKAVQATYEAFVEAAEQLEKEDQRITVRAVRDKIGGSNSKLVEFLRTWKENKQLASYVNNEDISKPLKQALLAAIGQAVQKGQEHLKKQLVDEKGNAQETLGLLVEMEAKCIELEEQITTLDTQYKATVLNFEKQIAGLTASLEDEKAREIKLEQKIALLQKDKHQAELKEAVAKSRYEQLEKQLSTNKA